MTASAFISLSLNPTLVLVSVDRSADTLPILQKTGRFNVSILSAHQENLSRQFATKNSPESNGLIGVDYSVGAGGLPLIKGALAYFECRTLHEYDGGDHIIFAGEVEAIEVSQEEEPLLYFRGHYRRLAPLVTP